MRNQLDKAIRRVMAARHAKHRRAAVLVILALLTILSVSWRLHQVGIAMTDDEYSCGYEEHVHSDACYTEVLICGYEDGASEPPADSAEEDGETAPAAHSHTADCYQRVLTCTLPEHTHTLECLADITADVETPADWDEQSEGVSSFWSDAMTEIAQRQLGYTESAKNFTVDKALGETLAQAHHYTRYGDWYGNPYGTWDVMFVAFCQHYAGIPEDVIPQCASLLQLRTELENAHPEYITPGGSEATPGDIVLYTNAAGEETIGIVTAYDGANLTVVSGAVDGAVAAVTVAEADVTNLSIPSIGLALPVMQQWSYPGLKIAPGRYSGALYTDDLVIAGHNYARHFSPLTHLTVGTEVLFVDMNDNTWHYAVSDTEVLQPTQIEEMAVKTSESNWDLTLFTCTTTGQARYALRCVRTDE